MNVYFYAYRTSLSLFGAADTDTCILICTFNKTMDAVRQADSYLGTFLVNADI